MAKQKDVTASLVGMLNSLSHEEIKYCLSHWNETEICLRRISDREERALDPKSQLLYKMLHLEKRYLSALITKKEGVFDFLRQKMVLASSIKKFVIPQNDDWIIREQPRFFLHFMAWRKAAEGLGYMGPVAFRIKKGLTVEALTDFSTKDTWIKGRDLQKLATAERETRESIVFFIPKPLGEKTDFAAIKLAHRSIVGICDFPDDNLTFGPFMELSALVIYFDLKGRHLSDTKVKKGHLCPAISENNEFYWKEWRGKLLYPGPDSRWDLDETPYKFYLFAQYDI